MGGEGVGGERQGVGQLVGSGEEVTVAGLGVEEIDAERRRHCQHPATMGFPASPLLP